MANNTFIYNGAIEGATGGLHERWITSEESADYNAIRNLIVEFATLVDGLIPTDPAISAADGALIQSITHGVLANRYLQPSDNLLPVARAIVALYSAIGGQQEPELITSDTVINLSDVPGANVTEALDNLIDAVAAGSVPAAPAGEPGSPSNTGYLTRHVYVNAASTRIGTTFAGETIEEAPTVWTTADEIPIGNWFIISIAGAGGGGGGGGGTEGLPGAGGGGGIRLPPIIVSRAELIAMLPISFSVGLGGTAGLGHISVNGVVTRPATAGGNGGSTSFGNITAGSGSGGQVNTTGHHGGPGGGIGNAPTPGNTNSAVVGGIPATVTGAVGVYVEGAGHGATTGNSTPGTPAVWGGASGGGAGTGENTAAGGRAIYGGAGGGAGRGTDTTIGAGAAGGAGGTRWTDSTTSGGGGAGGPGTNQNAVQPAPGDDGNDGDEFVNGDGGGGGGSSDGNVTTYIAGNGGDGGFPGGGAGGGGTTRLQLFASRNMTSGDGGMGGDAMLMITGLS